MNAANLKVGDRVLSPGLGCWVDSTIKRIDNQYLICSDTKHGGEFRVHASDCLPLNHFDGQKQLAQATEQVIACNKLAKVSEAVLSIMAGSTRLRQPTINVDGSIFCGNQWTNGETWKLEDLLGSGFVVKNTNGFVNVRVS